MNINIAAAYLAQASISLFWPSMTNVVYNIIMIKCVYFLYLFLNICICQNLNKIKQNKI